MLEKDPEDRMDLGTILAAPIITDNAVKELPAAVLRAEFPNFAPPAPAPVVPEPVPDDLKEKKNAKKAEPERKKAVALPAKAEEGMLDTSADYLKEKVSYGDGGWYN